MTIDLVLTDNISDIVSISKFLKVKKVIVAKKFANILEIEKVREKTKKEPLAFYFCHILDKADYNEVKKFKQKADLIAVQGGDVGINKFAVSNKLVDILLMPCDSHKLTFDTALARLAKQNNTRIGILFSNFLETKHGFERTMLFKQYIFVTRLLKKFKVDALFFSGAKKTTQMRNPEDLSAFANVLGFTESQAKRFTTILPKKILGGKK